MPAGYIVTGVNQLDQIGATGNLVPSMRVSFELADGAGDGSVTVPLVEGWEGEAQAKIEAQVAAMRRLLG